ncbi:hypothetical protein UF64_09560 [Thalassospira sp. HJ]|nr:hypothetical protein UF64_09560 [Thalassospira sp. HJ]
MVWLFRHVCGLVLLALLVSKPLYAETLKVPLPAGREEHYALQTGLLELALTYAPGQHRLELVAVDGLSQKRAFSLLSEGEVNVVLAGYSRAAEHDLLQIDFPLTKGLQGYRLLITRADNLKMLDRVENQADLRSICIGSGNSWVDTVILKHAGLCVTGGPGTSLYTMLENRRFDAMHLAIHEVKTGNIAKLIKQHGLAVYENVLLRYPYDFYFYLGKDSQSLHDEIEQGFRAAVKDGAIDRYFIEHPTISAALGFLRDHPGLHIIDLDNPEMTDQTSSDLYRYWFGN